MAAAIITVTATHRARLQVDRHNTYRCIEGIYFPHYESPSFPLRNTIVDSELVTDVDPATGRVRSHQLWCTGFGLTFLLRRKLYVYSASTVWLLMEPM